MTLLAFNISFVLGVLALAQIGLVAGFIARLRRAPEKLLPDDSCPRVALVICVRGKDPTLADCLDAALGQDYADYGVHIAVDSRKDPAWPLVKEAIARNPRTPADVQFLEAPLDSCSLKCSSLIQVISGLDPAYEVVAFLDTDVVPHHRWLKDLVAPLANPNVGASTGNRWFSNYPSSHANLARHAWNAAAVVLMYWLKIAWGGSLAIKRSVIDEGKLLTHWSHTFCEDTAINPALRKLGLRLEFVPSNISTSDGKGEFPGLSDWIARQLLACRLHHRGWWAVVTHGLGTSTTLCLAFLTLAAGTLSQRWDMVVPVSVGLCAYLAIMVWLLRWLDLAVAHAAPNSPIASENQRQNQVSTWKVIQSVLLAQFVYLWSLGKAAFANIVEWRGVYYRIDSHHGIHMVEYRTSDEVERLQSLRKPAGVGSI